MDTTLITSIVSTIEGLALILGPFTDRVFPSKIGDGQIMPVTDQLRSLDAPAFLLMMSTDWSFRNDKKAVLRMVHVC